MIKRKLHNRVAVVTGLSGEVESSLAHRLSKLGCHLIVGSNNEEALSRLETELSHLRVGVICQKTDISDPASIKNLVDTAMRHFARIDFLKQVFT
jgi:NAD(P)-dependent dehydrogenase (short-subunit alcohol dehydrogenase family)